MSKSLDGCGKGAVNAFTELLKRRQSSVNRSSTKSCASSSSTQETGIVPEFTTTVQYKAFELPNCKLNHTLLPDGSKKIVQTAPDFSSRVLLKRLDHSMEEKVFDRYGRPVFVKEVSAHGDWISSEWKYFDSEDKVSPFLSAKYITTSDGTVKEITYDRKGKITGQLERIAEKTPAETIG